MCDKVIFLDIFQGYMNILEDCSLFQYSGQPSKSRILLSLRGHYSNSSQILKNVDLEKDCAVCIDVCIEGLDGVLMQDNHMVCYE